MFIPVGGGTTVGAFVAWAGSDSAQQAKSSTIQHGFMFDALTGSQQLSPSTPQLKA
jgi:hypothetical protein